MTVKPERTAWTGGSSPRPWVYLSEGEKELVGEMYDEMVLDWQYYRGDQPPLDVLNTFWGRARYDAHATYRKIGSNNG